MKQHHNYSIDHSNRKIIVTKQFLKKAGIIGSDAYAELTKLRKENPNYSIEEREIAKANGKRTYRDLTYKNMKKHIEGREGENAPAVLAEFEHVQKVSKIKNAGYFYVKKWFLDRYKDEFTADEEAA